MRTCTSIARIGVCTFSLGFKPYYTFASAIQYSSSTSDKRCWKYRRGESWESFIRKVTFMPLDVVKCRWLSIRSDKRQLNIFIALCMNRRDTVSANQRLSVCPSTPLCYCIEMNVHQLSISQSISLIANIASNSFHHLVGAHIATSYGE